MEVAQCNQLANKWLVISLKCDSILKIQHYIYCWLGGYLAAEIAKSDVVKENHASGVMENLYLVTFVNMFIGLLFTH